MTRLLVFFLAAVGGCATAPGVPSPPITLACVGGTVIPGPGAAPIAGGVVLVSGRRIASVGPRAAVPPGVPTIDCQGALVLAGFWNSHVHFTEPIWGTPAPVPELEAALDDLVLRWGFVHVVDTGSFESTFALRRRIEAGELRGPSILTAAGTSFVTAGGQPVYLSVPLPELRTPDEARRLAGAAIDHGADVVKLFTASVVAGPVTPVMPVEVVHAVTAEAHRRGALVMAHPTNAAGVRAAADGGVDVLAHTAPQGGPWSAGEVAHLRASGIALIPTLKLWRYELARKPEVLARYEPAARAQVQAFAAAGGRLLFGTDVGYMADHDPGDEYRLLAAAGLSFDQILAMLTTAPAAVFGRGKTRGVIAAGEDADLVVLDGDPRRDPAAWTSVRYAVRAGAVLHGPSPVRNPSRHDE